MTAIASPPQNSASQATLGHVLAAMIPTTSTGMLSEATRFSRTAPRK